MDIRFDSEKKKGKSPTTRLYAPAKDGEEETGARPLNTGRAKTEKRGPEGPHVRVEKPELNPLARIGLIFCGFIFAGMVLFTLTGYERISRAYADINALNSEIDSTKLRTELGWTPRFQDFEAGLAATIDWYKANEPWWAPAKDGVEAFYASQGQ